MDRLSLCRWAEPHQLRRGISAGLLALTSPAVKVTEIPVPCLSWVSSPGRLWADRKWRSLPFPQGQHYLSLPLDITGLPAHPLLTPLLQTCCWERIMSVP